MYAVIEDSGTQFKVTGGDVINIDRILPEDEELPRQITFERVLLVAGDGEPKLGAPLVAGATVTADVLAPVKAKKLRIVKYNRRKNYHIEKGHRQKYLQVKVTGINV